MKLMGIVGLTLATCAISGGVAAPASAAKPCWLVAEAEKGLYEDQQCTNQGAGLNAKSVKGEIKGIFSPGSEGCVETEKANEGYYKSENECVKKENPKGLGGDFARVIGQLICPRVAVAGTGVYKTETECLKAENPGSGAGFEYIKVLLPLSVPAKPAPGIVCLHVITEKTGRYKTEEGCVGGKESEASEGEYIKVDVEETCSGELLPKAPSIDRAVSPTLSSPHQGLSPRDSVFTEIADFTNASQIFTEFVNS
jgi:hypothetical protein